MKENTHAQAISVAVLTVAQAKIDEIRAAFSLPAHSTSFLYLWLVRKAVFDVSNLQAVSRWCGPLSALPCFDRGNRKAGFQARDLALSKMSFEKKVSVCPNLTAPEMLRVSLKEL